MDKNQGYAILKAVMLENGRGFALGEHPTAPSRYVTWACYDDKDGQRQYEWGHYGNDRTAMEQDFADRVQDYQRMIIIYQPKTRRYEKPISRELAQLIGKAVSYANEHYPESIYIFADENKPERPISYQTLQDKVLRMIYEKDIRDDSGNLFGFGTHMFRHCYGVKLTELHVDDWTIAKLLGHKGVRSVQYYRKMSNQRMADETREVRNFMSQIILASLDGWGEEYEQIRQDAGIE